MDSCACTPVTLAPMAVSTVALASWATIDGLTRDPGQISVAALTATALLVVRRSAEARHEARCAFTAPPP
jgi:hypothetical protein